MDRKLLLRGAGMLGAFALLLTLTLLAIARARLAERIFGSYTLCQNCFFWPSLQHDAWLLAALLLLTAAGLAVRRYWLQLPLALAAVVLVLVCAIDVGLLDTLSQRLYWPELFRYAREPAAAWAVWRDAFKTDHGTIVLLYTLLAALALLLALLPRPRLPRLAMAVGAVALSVLAALTLAATPIGYVHPESVQNLFELNRDNRMFEAYSPAYIESLGQRLQALPERCENGLARRPNLILVVVESLSAYHSKLLGGPLDATPELDRMAAANTYFPQFIANGYTTDNGLIALLNGRLPTLPTGLGRSGSVFGGFDQPQGSTIELLRRAGYHTHFFGAFDLGFINTRSWLERIGFDAIEGVEHPYYQGLPRFLFGSAEDRALFGRLGQWLDQRDSATPFFAAALTISSHPPFVNPRDGRADEAGAVAYVDAELGRFEHDLRQRGYFRDGILIITGDHRSMTPLRAAERERYGDRAFARVPLIVVGADPGPGAVGGRFQQTDLLPSLDYLTGTRACRHAGQGAFLRADPQPAAYTLNVRGDAHGRIDVDFDGGGGALQLAGDDSRSSGALPPDWTRISDWIHADRIARSEGGDVLRQRLQQLQPQRVGADAGR